MPSATYSVSVRPAQHRKLQGKTYFTTATAKAMRSNGGSSLAPASLAYKYFTPIQNRQIRLVNLLPGFWDDPLRFWIEVASLDDVSKPFEALSYFWGDQRKTRDVFCEGEIVPVPVNLFSALSHLRTYGEPRRLWIDALCINQGDKVEKSVQVNMMGEIYKTCEKGILWLGEESEEIDEWCAFETFGACKEQRVVSRTPVESAESIYADPGVGDDGDVDDHIPEVLALCKWHGNRPRMSEAFKLLEVLAEGVHLYEIPGFAYLTSRFNTDHLRFVEPIQALWALLRRPWWNRIWTVQETVLPENTTLVCGALEIRWETIVKAASQLQHHATNPCCSSLHENITGHLLYQTHGKPTCEILKRFPQDIKTLDNVRSSLAPSSSLELLQLVQFFGHRQASNPLDKIYGLLGLLAEGERLIDASYTVDMMNLNRELSQRILQSSERLYSKFSVMYGDERHVNSTPLPSWAKDFGQTLDRTGQRIEEDRERNRRDYNASANKSSSVVHHGGTVMSMNCVHVGQVAKTTDVACSKMDPESVKHFLSSKCAPVIEYKTRKNLIYPVCPGTARDPDVSVENRGAFYRTIFGNRRASEAPDGVRRRPTDNDINQLKTWVFFWPNEHLPDNIRSQLLSDIGFHILNRKFFITKAGLVGFGPSNMEPGDDIWIPGGSNVPFVFRPLDDPGPKEMGYSPPPTPGSRLKIARRWRAVVGDCYVHGVMEAEAAGKEQRVLFLK